jgi:hypothetical protein
MTEDELVAALGASAARTARAGLHPPASLQEVEEAERAIGLRLHPPLRRLHLEVANGGFGPRGAMLGLPGGYDNATFRDVVEAYRAFADDPEHPGELVPVLDWGCAIWTLVDCQDPAGGVWGWDPNGCCTITPCSPSTSP